jgi:hypothetical protein
VTQLEPARDEPRDGVRVVVDRRSGTAQAVAVALFVAAVLGVALFARKRALLALFAGVRALGELASDVPYVAVPQAVELGALLVVLLGPVVVWVLLARWARRTARVEVGHDEVVLDRPLGRWLLDDRRVVVPAASIEAVEAGPTGLRLVVPGLGRVGPLLPILDPAEQAAAVRALDAARDPAREAGRALVGPGLVPTHKAVPTIAVAVLAFFACASVELVLGLPASLALLAVWAVGVVGSTRRLAERHAQVLVGARRLAVADAVAAWSAVRGVAIAPCGPEGDTAHVWLAADLGPTAGPSSDGRRLARLPLEARDRIEPLLRERLGGRLTTTLPEWAARRATPGALLAPHLLAVVAGLVGLLALPLVHDLYVWTDHRGQELRLLVRRLDASVRRVVVCPVAPASRVTRSVTGPWSAMVGSEGGPELARGRLEWPDGRTAPIPRDAKVIVVGPGTVTCDTRLLPSPRGDQALAQSLALLPDELGELRALSPHRCVAVITRAALLERSTLLADVGEGRRGSSCDVAYSPARGEGRLRWQVEEGRVMAVLLAVGPEWGVERGPCWCRTPDQPPLSLLVHPHEGPPRKAHRRVTNAPLPTLDQVLEARDRIAAGATLRQATEAWAPELWR